jgi:hypothetical protein
MLKDREVVADGHRLDRNGRVTHPSRARRLSTGRSAEARSAGGRRVAPEHTAPRQRREPRGTAENGGTARTGLQSNRIST